MQRSAGLLPFLTLPLAAVLWSGSVHAQDAQALFDQGLGDMKAGRYKIGCLLIKRSFEIDARPGTAFTLAECYGKGGKYASAVEMYDEYLARFDKLPPDQQARQAERVQISKSERARYLTLVAWVTVRLPPSAPEGVVVTRDDEGFPSSLLGVATAMDPGPHRFTTRAPDGPLVEQRVDLGSGERKELVLDVRSPESAEAPPATGTAGTPESSSSEATPPEEPSPGEREHHTSPWIYVTGGLGAAGFLTAAVAGGMLLSKRAVVKDQCSPDKLNPDGSIPCSQEGKDAADLAQHTLAPITEIGLGVGAAGAIATVLLLLLDKPKKEATGWSEVRPNAQVTREGAFLGVQSVW